MAKPSTFEGYSEEHTVDCERVLVTLLRGLGPWKDSVYLVGGLTPRYLVAARPPVVPSHTGTLDVDIVVDLQILTSIEGYRTLEENLRKMEFERSLNDIGQRVSWRWQTRMDHGGLIVVELLADRTSVAGGSVEQLPTDGTISALNIPHSSIVFDLHQVVEIRAELLRGAGTSVELVKHANLVSFTCLKAFAFDQRFERKDAYDLIYCIEHTGAGLEGAAQMFREALEGNHGMVIQDCLLILKNRFAGDDKVAGYQKDGPIAVSRFELGDGDEADQREARILRQRVVCNVIEQLLARIN